MQHVRRRRTLKRRSLKQQGGARDTLTSGANAPVAYDAAKYSSSKSGQAKAQTGGKRRRHHTRRHHSKHRRHHSKHRRHHSKHHRRHHSRRRRGGNPAFLTPGVLLALQKLVQKKDLF